MKAYAFHTPDFAEAMSSHFDATVTLSGLDMQRIVIDDFGPVGEFDTPSALAFAMKRDRFVLGLLETETEPFLVTDTDVRFYGRVVEKLESAIIGKDIAFQSDHPNGYPCMGFFAIRPNERTRVFMRAVIAECEHSGRNDQESAKDVLDRWIHSFPMLPVAWHYLPSAFWSYGASTGKRWSPGDSVNPPSDLLMHHGNWTVGTENKIALLDTVRNEMERRARTDQTRTEIGALPTVDFFLVTYPKDYDWLPYLFGSIERFATGFRKLVLVIEEQDQPPQNLPAYVEVKRCCNYRGTEVEGYWGQSIEGLRAHLYSDADVIWFLESDCVFTRPIDVRCDKDWPASKPVIVKRSWDNAGLALKWQDSTVKVLGGAVAETMCCHPFVYHRTHIAETWVRTTEETLRDVVKSGAGLSQFNILGNVELIYQSGRFAVVDLDSGQLPRPCMRQFWSHARPTDAKVMVELRKLGLATAEPARVVNLENPAASPKREPSSLANPPIAIAIQFWEGDQDKALRLARFLADLEPAYRDDAAIVLCRRFDVPMDDAITATLEHCKIKFPVAQIRSERELEGHPNGCYGLWAGTAEQCYRHYTQDWPYESVFFVEADGVPCRRDWIDWLKRCHSANLEAGKRITGPLMQAGRHYGAHVNGCFAIHLSCWADHPSLHTCRRGVPWDIFHAQVLRGEAGPSQPIFNVYGAPGLTPDGFRSFGREYAWLANVKDESAWECAQEMLPHRSRKRWRLVYVAAETRAVLAAGEKLYLSESEVELPKRIEYVPPSLRDGVHSGRVKVAVQEVDVT